MKENIEIRENYCYKITSGNPEGFDWVMDLYHKEKFNNSSFKKMVENALMYSMKKERGEKGYSIICSIDTDAVIDYLEKLGFVISNKTQARYDFEPYWGRKNLSKKFAKFLDENETLNEKWQEDYEKRKKTNLGE